MKTLKVMLLTLLPFNLFANDYVFKVDDQLNASASDTVYYEGTKMQAYQDAKSWFMEQKWTAQVTNDNMGEGFDFDANIVTKARYNPLIHTTYSDYITTKVKVIVEEKRVVVLFDDIQFGESVQGIGQKSSTQPLAQKIYKLDKERKVRKKLSEDNSIDKKTKKKELSKSDDTIKDIEDSLKEVDEEIRVRFQNLKKTL